MKRTQMTGLVLVLLAGMASAATLQMQVVGSEITGLTDGQTMWDSSGGAAIPWVDQTGNGHDAATTQSYWAPRYQAGETGKFNEKAYVNRDGTADRLLGSCSFSDWNFTGVVVGNFSTAGMILSFANSGSGVGYTILELDADGNLTVGIRNDTYGSVTATTSGTDYLNADHLFVVEYRAADDFEVFVDGTSVLTYSGSAGGLTPSNLNRYGLGIDADNNQSLGMVGDIAEARYYTGTWSDGEMESMASSLMSTYGITPEPATLGVLMLGGGLAVLRRRRNRRA